MSYITINPGFCSKPSDFNFPHFGNILNEVMRTSISDIVSYDNNKVRHTTPAVNVKELSDQFILEMTIPGLSKKEVNISIEEDKMVISSNMAEREDTPTFTLREFNFGDFKRTFILPDSINKDKITASFKNGILLISLAKKEEKVDKGPQKIKIS